jgi:single-strand DNA-binding protein
MLNVVALQGRLARDPELRQTTTGKQVATFTLACDRGRKDANGRTTADWIQIVAWDRLADFAAKWLTKGQMVTVDGRLQSRTYQGKDGTNRTAVEVVANNINFCGSKADNAAQAAPAGQPRVTDSAPAYNQGPDDDFAMIEDEGDLPF